MSLKMYVHPSGPLGFVNLLLVSIFSLPDLSNRVDLCPGLLNWDGCGQTSCWCRVRTAWSIPDGEWANVWLPMVMGSSRRCFLDTFSACGKCNEAPSCSACLHCGVCESSICQVDVPI